jgi:hypothetical protein
MLDSKTLYEIRGGASSSIKGYLAYLKRVIHIRILMLILFE